MKKKIIILAALCVALSACGGQNVEESKSPATPLPTAAVTGVQTSKPSATPLVTVEPTIAPTPEPTAVPTAVITPMPTSRPTHAPTPGAKQSETPVIHVIESLPPEESIAPPPEPIESLCGLPMAPTPGVEETPEPPASETPGVLTSGTPGAEPSPAVSGAPANTSEPTATPEPAQPTDEEVILAYREASEAYRWFDLTTLPLDYSVTKMVGDVPYNPVSDERFPNMDSLRGYLKGLFSDEIVDALLPVGEGSHYIDIDGELCARDADRGTNENTGEITKVVVWPEEGGDNLCSVQVTVELLWEDANYPEGVRKYEFPYQKVGDKWVFTHFEPIM